MGFPENLKAARKELKAILRNRGVRIAKQDFSSGCAKFLPAC